MTKDQAMIHVLMKENDELKLEIGRLRNNSIIIPENATNGDMLKAMFPNLKIGVFRNEVDVEGLDTYSVFTRNWWDKPYYKKDRKEV